LQCRDAYSQILTGCHFEIVVLNSLLWFYDKWLKTFGSPTNCFHTDCSLTMVLHENGEIFTLLL